MSRQARTVTGLDMWRISQYFSPTEIGLARYRAGVTRGFVWPRRDAWIEEYDGGTAYANMLMLAGIFDYEPDITQHEDVRVVNTIITDTLTMLSYHAGG